MTILTGRPDVPANTPLAVRLLWDTPLQGGARGLSPKFKDGTYDWASGTWVVVGGAALSFPHPRPGVNDNALKGPLLAVVTIGNGTTSQTVRYPLSSVETSVGQLDLTVDPAPVGIVASPDLLALVANATGLNASVQTGLTALNTGLASIPPALADIAQSTAALEAATATALGSVGIPADRIYDEGVAPPAAPDGTYAAQLQPSGLFQRLKRIAGAWVNSGSPLMSLLGMQLRLGGVNVRDYGALGNGVTNDSAAFAAAELAAFNADKWVRIPDGNYLLNSEFVTRVSVRLEDGATLTAGAAMPAVIGTDGAVLYKNKRISGGRIDGRNLAVRGMWLRYGQYAKIVGTEVESPNLYHYQVGMLGSPVPSYEINVNDVRGDRSRGTTYEQQNDGSVVLLVENCTDSHFSDNILIGADTGILDRNGGNNHYHLQHAWARMGENRMLECFVVESAKTRWTQCTADTPLQNGWNVKNWHTVIENSMVFNNGQGAPTTVQGVAYPGMTGIKFQAGVSYGSVHNVNFQGQSTRYIAKDIDAPGMQYLSITGKHSQYVTEMYTTDYVQSSLSLGYVKRFFLNNLSAWWLNLKAVSGDLEVQARSSTTGGYTRSPVTILRDASEIQFQNQTIRQRSTDPALNMDQYLERGDKRRWGWTLTPDSGVSNGGGELRLSNYDDAGNYIGDLFRAHRDASNIDFRTTSTRFNVYDDAADLNLFFQRSGSRRFGVSLSTEPGGVGGNLTINRYSAAGAFVATPFKIDRATGAVTMTDGLAEVAGTFDKPLILAAGYSLYINPGTGKLQLKSSRTPASASDGASLVRTNDLATIGVAGVVNKAAALTATVPTSTALTFSSPPTQAECQALAARVEQIRAFQADLFAKQQTAGQQT